MRFFFFFNDTATTEIYTLSLHDALPISDWQNCVPRLPNRAELRREATGCPKRRGGCRYRCFPAARCGVRDRKSTRLNSSHGYISYAVFCLKKKKDKNSTSARCTKYQWLT